MGTVSPVPAITACLGTALVIGIMTGSAEAIGAFEVPECEGFLDVVTGCDHIVSKFLNYVVLGTIPGAHIYLHGGMGVVGIALRATAIQYGLDWIRGR